MRLASMLLLSALIGACATRPAPEPLVTTDKPPDFPATLYAGGASPGQAVYRVDPAASEIIIRVGRTGSLARLGHDHVLAVRRLHGGVLIDADPGRSRADLYFSLSELELDTPSLRSRAGLTGQLTADEIAQTRAHMLDDELDVQLAPWVLVSAAWASGTRPGSMLQVRLTLHGVTRSLRVPVSYAADSRRVQVSGSFRIRQTAFGLKPYSTLGGALAVDDWLGLSFQIEAKRTQRRGLPSGKG